MKRKYEVVSTEVKRHALIVTVEVIEIGPSWGIQLVIPWSQINQNAAYEAAELEHERQRSWDIEQQLRNEPRLF